MLVRSLLEVQQTAIVTVVDIKTQSVVDRLHVTVDTEVA